MDQVEKKGILKGKLTYLTGAALIIHGALGYAMGWLGYPEYAGDPQECVMEIGMGLGLIGIRRNM